MTPTLESLKKFRTIEELLSASKIEAIPHHAYTTRYTYKITLPVAPKLLPQADLRFRVATKAEAIASGIEMTRLALRNAIIGLPGYGADTRKMISLPDFLAADSIDSAYEQARF